ncbi:MAG: Flp family type IVb pilin [Methylobacterium sp.]|uniref:Flp family type IVb pilin n=1 Tax=Methylobacterium sp. TaxID=409 RepID=UPI00258F7650|nr:Flp family type IVb pilin [Methylobacterium sp.]MBY0296014.1 Flp family type IVb pilin [Methylobacterium sp.]
MTTLMKRFVSDESGATAIEYGLLATLIAVALIAAATTVGTNIGVMFNSVANKIKPAS